MNSSDEAFASEQSVIFRDDGHNAKRRELHSKLAVILEEAKDLRSVVSSSPVLSLSEKGLLEKQIGDITAVASQRADNQNDDIMELKDSIEGAKERLNLLEKRIGGKIGACAPKVLEKFRTETKECLKKLKESGAESADNILHDKYSVVKRISDIIGDKKEGEDPVAILNGVKVELESRNYGVNSRESYRATFNQNKQPSGMEILTTRRHAILDKFISVIKQIFTHESPRNQNHNAQPDTNNSFRFFNRTVNLPKIKTVAAMPTLSNLVEPLQPKSKK